MNTLLIPDPSGTTRTQAPVPLSFFRRKTPTDTRYNGDEIPPVRVASSTT